jgi:hypothetical protein
MSSLYPVILILFAIGQPPGTPGVLIEDNFQSRHDCFDYVEKGGGWSMARSTFGLNDSPDPIPGFYLVCLEST